MQHLVTLFDLTASDIKDILQLTAELKADRAAGHRPQILAGHTLIQLFEKPSLRTRISFESAINELGGDGTFMGCAEAGLGGRESLEDVARVTSSYADFVVLRTFSHELIERFATVSSCPVINGLSDGFHPCQALTDVFTIKEVFGTFPDRRLVYVGDGNNVTRSLAIAAAHLQLPFTICTPPEYQVDAEFLSGLKSRMPSADVIVTHDPAAAVRDASVVYTDVWASMGQEKEAETRQQAFADYQINGALMSQAPAECRFMHCLPARRGIEVTDEVVDGPQSVVFEQAENRKHLAKGLFVWLHRQRSR